jgi:hypothetical protein
VKREKCTVEGKDIFVTRDDALAALPHIRARNKGKGKVYRCPFGDHYHWTKGLSGRKGRRDFR